MITPLQIIYNTYIRNNNLPWPNSSLFLGLFEKRKRKQANRRKDNINKIKVPLCASLSHPHILSRSWDLTSVFAISIFTTMQLANLKIGTLTYLSSMNIFYYIVKINILPRLRENEDFTFQIFPHLYKYWACWTWSQSWYRGTQISTSTCILKSYTQ